jgi:hypothetical protein
MQSEHSVRADAKAECQAVIERRELTRALQKVIDPDGRGFTTTPDDGSDRSLAVTFAVLRGIINEYLDGGDQMADNCTCGRHHA